MDRNHFGVSPSMGSLSPYLNIDPNYLAIDSEPQFIMPDGANQHRGRFELAFSQIGGSVCVGAAVGGTMGLYTGLKETKVAQITGPVRRTQLLNFITKRGASSAQSLGVIALIYSAFGVILSKSRGADDEVNTLTAATATGLLYKSSGGLKKALRGGGVGLGLAMAYCLINSRENVKKILGISR